MTGAIELLRRESQELKGSSSGCSTCRTGSIRTPRSWSGPQVAPARKHPNPSADPEVLRLAAASPGPRTDQGRPGGPDRR